MVIFAGSCISTAVSNRTDETVEDIPSETVLREAALPETSMITEMSVSFTAVSDSGTAVFTSATEPVTTVPEVSETEETETEETEVPEETEEEITETESETEAETVPQTEAEKPSGGSHSGDYNYGAPVPESGQVKGSDYYDTCAFVGDSHTNGLGAYGFVDKSRIFAKDGLSISNIRQSISPSSIAAVSPENVYIMMGTNGIAWLKPSDMIASYEEYAADIASQIPGVNIYILSIPPVSYERSTTTDAKKNISMDKIREYNSGLQDMAARNEWYFVDTFSEICGSSGYLEGSTDGIHMPVDLYRKFTDYILSHTVE